MGAFHIKLDFFSVNWKYILQSLGLFIISLIEHSSLNDITTDKSNVAVKLLALGMTKKIIIKKSVVFAVFY